jgi:hypothetical protein
MPSSLTLVPTLGNNLFYPSFLHFFKVCIDCPRQFHLGISVMFILCFNQTNFPITYSFSSPSSCFLIIQ